MKLNNFLEGLKTLQPFYKDGNGHHIGAEHDQFYAYATDTPLTPEAVENMLALGWFQPEQEDEAPYDPEEGWSAFT